MTKLPLGFGVVLASSIRFEKLTAEIFFDGRFVALISQERGLDFLDLEMPDTSCDDDQITRKVDLNGFLQAMQVARARLRGEVE